jgi:hypothetical protein
MNKEHVRNAMVLVMMAMSFTTTANIKTDNHLPINHCYHWIDEANDGYLSYKYKYAQQNNGEMTFYTNPASSNGAVAGPGLYCGKTPADSYGYGDRVVRVDFVDDIVMLDAGTNVQYCGHNGDYYKNSADCQKRPWDIKFYSGGGRGNYAWYVIRNPQSIISWSANSSQLIQDLNAAKPFENGSYSIHADNTITKMKRENELLVVNNNARLSILKILKDSEKLSQMPPLTVIVLVENFKGPELSGSDKSKIYLTQFSRGLEDTKLLFSDFMNVVKDNSYLVTAFKTALLKIDMNKLDKVNPVLVLQGLDKFSSDSVTNEMIKKLWGAAILSNNDLESLVDTSLSPKGVFANSLESSLPQLDDIKKKISSHNLVPLMNVLNKYVVDGSSKHVSDVFKLLLKDLIDKKGAKFSAAYDKLDNPLLNKEVVLTSLVSEVFLSPGYLKKADPLTLGEVLDRVATKMNPHDLKTAQDQVLALPLVVDTVPTYQILDDYSDKKFKLPSFISEKDFLLKLIDRSIAERDILKTPTNTFRMVMSGLFTHFNAEVRKAKDGAKDVASQKVSDSLLEIAAELESDDRVPYRYITLQNASYFLGKGRSKDHPMEHVIASYKQGDTAYDQFIEETVSKAYDGSLLQYLIYNSKSDPILAGLLQMTVTHLLSQDFDQTLTSGSFILSQAEKKSWSNIISNKAYSPSDNSRVPSQICHLANVFKRYSKDASGVLSTSDMKSMDRWVQSMENGFCKRN